MKKQRGRPPKLSVKAFRESWRRNGGDMEAVRQETGVSLAALYRKRKKMFAANEKKGE